MGHNQVDLLVGCNVTNLQTLEQTGEEWCICDQRAVPEAFCYTPTKSDIAGGPPSFLVTLHLCHRVQTGLSHDLRPVTRNAPGTRP